MTIEASIKECEKMRNGRKIAKILVSVINDINMDCAKTEKEFSKACDKIVEKMR